LIARVAYRKCGEWLQENIKQGRPEKGSNTQPFLSDIGINKTESHRLQKIASIPEEKFEGILQEAAGFLHLPRPGAGYSITGCIFSPGER